ncbi:MAG: aminopeptidase [Gammaproteobacteria bacterium]|nr:aminopeptidase [Gammaproteobacteria bacterium]MDH5226257.1 aminopeptidase [Gammaproteobacteria bacterium]
MQRLLRLAAIWGVLAASAPMLTGCYVMQAATGQAAVIHRSEPIASVVANPSTPQRTRERLLLVEHAREFAINELALPDGRSYRKYADLGRPNVVHNVVATPEFSVEPRSWCFPIAGCISYRGYFNESSARSYALRLAMKGDDVSVDGVPTYSTLGHLPDPVFGPMLSWRDTRLVGTIFHELAHERLYLAGDSALNEAFASVVEDEGVRRWLQQVGRASEIAGYDAAIARQKEFASLLLDTRARLARLYATKLAPEAMRIEKQREFGRLLYRYEVMRRDRWQGYAAYDAWFARSLNNAHLASVATYEGCVPGLQRLLRDSGSALPEFYARVEATRGMAVKERRAALCQ